MWAGTRRNRQTVRPSKSNALSMEPCKRSHTLHLRSQTQGRPPVPGQPDRRSATERPVLAPRSGPGLAPLRPLPPRRAWPMRPHTHSTTIHRHHGKAPHCYLHVCVIQLPTDCPGQPCDVRGHAPGSNLTRFECPAHHPSGLSRLSPPGPKRESPAAQPRSKPPCPGRAHG